MSAVNDGHLRLEHRLVNVLQDAVGGEPACVEEAAVVLGHGESPVHEELGVALVRGREVVASLVRVHRGRIIEPAARASERAVIASRTQTAQSTHTHISTQGTTAQAHGARGLVQGSAYRCPRISSTS